MPNPLIGIGLHGVGALSSALCYTPQRKSKDWSWQTYWLTQAAVCWLILPLIVAVMTTPHLLAVLRDSPSMPMIKAFFLGLCYGVGGTAFGVAIRYLGFSITYAISVGLSSVIGTLLPPILSNQLSMLFHQNGSGWIFAGLGIAALGIAASGVAGKLRDENKINISGGESNRHHLVKGMLYAVVAGVLSAFFGIALSVGQPITDVAVQYGAGQFQGNVVLALACSGAFLSTAIICLVLHVREGSLHEYIAFVDGPTLSLLATNFGLAALTGALWYGQFLLYGVAHTFMGRYKFVSWTLHMTMLVLFSAMVGVALKEWSHCKRRTIAVLASALFLLLGAVGTIAYGSYIGGQ